MNIIKHIRIYDMDDTLFFTPKPDVDDKGEKIFRLGINTKDGKEKKFLTNAEYETNKGEPWSFGGWWGRRESLDLNTFDIKRNEYIYDEYIKDMNGVDKLMIMMTGRIKPLEGQVRQILDFHKMKFDRYYFNPGGISTLDYKIEVLDKYISENKHLETIKFYDDRDEHIPVFNSWAEKIMKETGIDIEVVHVRGEGRVN